MRLLHPRRRDVRVPGNLRSPALAPGASVVCETDDHRLSAQRETGSLKHEIITLSGQWESESHGRFFFGELIAVAFVQFCRGQLLFGRPKIR